MSRRLGAALLAGALLAPLTGSVLPASAAPPTLTVSATSGAPGTAISVTGTGCTSTDDASREIVTNLVAGTAPDERLAGQSETYDGFDDGGSPILVPTWIDPAQPAVIEAACWEFPDETDDTVAGSVLFSYDPVPFDVLAGPGNAQTATAARTTAASGQLITFTLTDCTVGDEVDGPFPSGLLFAGVDLSGRTLGAPVAFAADGYEDGVTDATYLVLTGFDGKALPDGDYTFVPSCGRKAGIVSYEPQVITVSGSKPFDQIELRTDDTSTVTIAGRGCLEGDVQVTALAVPLTDFPDGTGGVTIDTGAEPFRLHRTRSGLVGGPAVGADRFGATRADRAGARATRADSFPASHDATVTPAADGSWSTTWDTGIVGDAIVLGFATCGDPLADGFFYDQVFGEFTAAAPTPTTAVPISAPVTVPTAPAPAPAVAVAGRPNYAG